MERKMGKWVCLAFWRRRRPPDTEGASPGIVGMLPQIRAMRLGEMVGAVRSRHGDRWGGGCPGIRGDFGWRIQNRRQQNHYCPSKRHERNVTIRGFASDCCEPDSASNKTPGEPEIVHWEVSEQEIGRSYIK